MSRVRRRYKFTKKTYKSLAITILIIAALIVGIMSLFRRNVLEYSAINMQIKNVDAIIIRDEECLYSDEGFDKINFMVKEGEYVEAGTHIADVYHWGYNDEFTQSLLNLESETYNQQLSILEGVATPDLDEINSRISSLINEISKYLDGENDDDILELNSELIKLLLERIEYLNNSVQANEKLQELYNQGKTIDEQIDKWKEQIVAKKSGIVSFYMDGYEQIISSENIRTHADTDLISVINADLVRNIFKSGNEVGITSNVDKALYRVINNNHWYIAFNVQTSGFKRVKKGEVYEITINGIEGKTFRGTALEPVVHENTTVNVIELNEDIGDLINQRSISIDLYKSAQGIMIPQKSINHGKDGLFYIRINNGMQGNENGMVPVDIIATDDKNAIISSRSDYQLNAGLEYIN